MELEQLSTSLIPWRRGVPLLPHKWWKENRDVADATIPAIPLRRGTAYHILEAHRLAHAQHDPLLSPHGFFRALPAGRNTAAIEFVEQFGPLDWPVNEGQPLFVLRDFWSKHLRYVSVVRLWETRANESQLRSAFSDLCKNLERIQLAEGWQSFADAPELSNDWEDLGVVPLCPLGGTRWLPWTRANQTFERWLDDVVFEDLREGAIHIFHGELNVHLVGREPRWMRMNLDDPTIPVSFRLSFDGGNLWQKIWELTGLDTAQVQSWRMCPACNVLFYPKRSDQYYCRSEEQVRASKRNYARTRRQRERLEKLLATPEDSPRFPLARKKRSVLKQKGSDR
jgi:hypothetical protein